MKKIGIVLAGLALSLAVTAWLTLAGCENLAGGGNNVPPADITWEVAADGSVERDTATLTFTFSAAVTELTADNIILSNGTGSVEMGELSGGGTSWTLGVTVATAGNITALIAKDGIEIAQKPVTVCKVGEPVPPAGYTVSADGGASAGTTALTFTFSKEITGLTADDITVADGTGIVEMGKLSGGGKNWTLGVTVNTAGNINVSIDEDKIEDVAKPVTVYKKDQPVPDITYTVTANGSATADTAALTFNFSGTVTGLNADDITVSGGTGNVTKGSLTGAGKSWRLWVTVNRAGNITAAINKGGIEDVEKPVTVYKKDQPVPDITYTVTANGSATAGTTALTFNFSGTVASLSADDITVANGTGSVTVGSPTGGGASWTLGVTVNTAGNINVSIDKDGIEDLVKPVTVYKKDQPVPPITYTVTANGDASAGTTALTFNFSGTVTGLLANNITLTGGTGSVTKGSITGGGTSWTLGVTVNTTGDIKVSIDKDGIEDEQKDVTVYKPPITYTVTANGTAETGTTTLTFTFSAAITGLSDNNITLTNDTGSVTKGSLSGGGKNWTLAVMVNTAGNIKVSITKDGIAAVEKPVTVYKKDQPAPPTGYTVTANGGATADTTALTFDFSAAVTGLLVNNITVANGTGSVTKGNLTGDGDIWTLWVTVNTPGNIKVSITKDGIEDGQKDVTVYKPPITYTVTANGSETAATTTLTFTFSKVVAGLSANNITLSNDTGSVTKVSLSGSGKNWTLEVAVNTAGNIKVSITKDGIESGQKDVTVYDITYTVTPNGGATADTTALTFNFSGTVTGLNADDITVADDTGRVTKGNLTGDGTSWTLEVTVNTAGNIKVSIDKAGIESGQKDVTVFKPITYTVTPNGGATADTTALTFNFSGTVASLSADDITVADGTGSVTVGSLTGGGASWTLGVTVVTAGNIKVSIDKAGIESGQKDVTVFKAPRYTITFDSNGGSTVEPITEVTGTVVQKPADPTRQDCAFKGWFNMASGGTEYAWPYTLTGNVTMYAQWTINTSTESVTLSINDFKDKADGVIPGDEFTLTKPNGTKTITVSGADSGAEVVWYIGVAKIGTGSSVTLSAANLPVGGHTLRVTAKYGGVRYSKEVAFKVQ
jgi:uncharacterized repeat protein (TIGR02543 family)